MKSEPIKLVLATVIAMAAIALLVHRFVPAPGTATEQAILAELQKIRRALEDERRAAPADAQRSQASATRVDLTVSIADAPAMGDAKAPLTLVEFTDFQCPFCKRFHEQTFPGLKKKYVDTGRLRYVVRHLPLGIHPLAPGAAHAALCAREQGRYFDMEAVLFRNSPQLQAERLTSYASTVGADSVKFEACMKSRRHEKEVQASAAEAQRLGLTGTPSFILGRAHGETVEGRKIVGAQPLAAFEREIEAELERAN